MKKVIEEKLESFLNIFINNKEWIFCLSINYFWRLQSVPVKEILEYYNKLFGSFGSEQIIEVFVEKLATEKEWSPQPLKKKRFKKQ